MNENESGRSKTSVNHINVNLAEKTKREIDATTKILQDAQLKDDTRVQELNRSDSRPFFKFFGLRS